MPEYKTGWEAYVNPEKGYSPDTIQLIIDPETCQPTKVGHEGSIIVNYSGTHIITEVVDSSRIKVHTIYQSITC